MCKQRQMMLRMINKMRYMYVELLSGTLYVYIEWNLKAFSDEETFIRLVHIKEV